ncbi:MAG: L-histidine N(alpha)-methyltransferase [Acidobacteria bacterium]|nr:L-histidine N(alpha)-methyltransferase [Acidobacteriota bacterium]
MKMQARPLIKTHALEYSAFRAMSSVSPTIQTSEMLEDVRKGLGRSGQKQLPCKYFYDDVGSALFDVITLLPEYGLTKADVRLLEKHSKDFAKLATNASVIVEFGSGNGAKARLVLEAFTKRNPLAYCPIDLSRSALERCRLELAHLDFLEVKPLLTSYFEGLRAAAAFRSPGSSMAVLFLGSSIGNFGPSETEEFCRTVREALLPGDLLLLSTDLEKEVPRMLAAYEDSLGVTAAFNLNVLARINREIGGNFDLKRFRHMAKYDEENHRIEMHLVSLADQKVHIGAGEVFDFREGETIWTESCYKFDRNDVIRLGERTGFRCEAQWVDGIWSFAQTVLRVV